MAEVVAVFPKKIPAGKVQSERVYDFLTLFQAVVEPLDLPL